MSLHPPFSALISVYFNDDPKYFYEALNSLVNQTISPDEIVIVNDGKLPSQLNEIQNRFIDSSSISVNIVRLSKNLGLGRALAVGVENCKYDLIARMDSDDISLPNRFELQLKYMMSNPNIDVLGGSINEIPSELPRVRKAPSGDGRIKAIMKIRNPMNHVTVMMKKQAVMDSGSYLHMPFFEDYFLWFRMRNKYNFDNLNTILVNVRTGNEMVERRRGLGYISSEINFFKAVKNLGHINSIELLFILLIRLPARLLPTKALKFLYFKLLRT